MKLYARQINPEYQTSPLFYEDAYLDNVIITGNSRFHSHTTFEYNMIVQCYEELCDEYENIKNKTSRYKNLTALLKGYFPERYSPKTVHKFKEVLEKYDTRYYFEGDYILDMLEIVTGKKWERTTIRGCCQSEWQEVIFSPEEYSKKEIDDLEIMYFNMGSEWIIHDDENEPESPEDINGGYVYCTSWDRDGIIKELSIAAGYDPEEVILYEFSGYDVKPVYVKVGA